MKKSFKWIFSTLVLVILILALSVPVFAASETDVAAEAAPVAETVEQEDNTISAKALAAAITVGLAAAAGAIGMAWAIVKSVEGIARQPEAEGKIRTTLMLGLVFVETAIIYALVIAILIIFVL